MRARHRQARRPEVIDLGTPPRADRVSLILWGSSDVQRLRCQMGLFAVDPMMRASRSSPSARIGGG